MVLQLFRRGCVMIAVLLGILAGNAMSKLHKGAAMAYLSQPLYCVLLTVFDST